MPSLFSKSNHFWYLTIFVVTLVAYFPVSQCHYIWDDDNYVTENATLRSLEGLKEIWLKPGAVPQYYPLVHSTFWIEYQIWKLNPLGYHFVNVFLHATAACLLFLLLLKLGIPGAGMIAMVFALHPINVESVAWITERKNVLSAVFYLGSFVAYLRFSNREPNNLARSKGFLGPYFFSFSLYVAALLSKTVTCSLPAVLIIIHWWRGEKLTLKKIGALIPFFVIGITFGLITVHMEKNTVGASGEEWNIPFISRCIIAGKALWFYIGKLVWPAEFIFIYPRWEVKELIWSHYLAPITFGLILIGLFLFRSHKGCRSILSALAIYSVSLFPALGFFDVYPMRYSFVADHFQYLAGISILALLIGAVAWSIPKRHFENHKSQTPFSIHELFRLRHIGSFLLVMFLGSLSWNRCYAFINSETLWVDTINKNPAAWIAHNNLGLIYQNKGKHLEAVDRFRAAIKLKQDHAYAFNNLAMSLDKLGQFDNAKVHFHNALKLKPFDLQILNNCGNFFARNQQFDQALIIYQKALEIYPHSPKTLINLGNLYAQNQREEEAIASYKKVLEKDPENAFAHYNWGNAMQSLGREKEAREHFRQAMRINPFFEAPRKKLRNLQKDKLAHEELNEE